MEPKKKRTVEEFVSSFMAPAPAGPDNYVGVALPDAIKKDPAKVAEVRKDLAAEKERNYSGGTKVLSKTGNNLKTEGDVIDVGGFYGNEPAAPVAPPAPSVKETIKAAMPAAAPQAAPQAPIAPTAPAASNELVIPKVPKDDSFPWDRLLMGATPLLVGMLTGNQMEGTDVSAKQFVGAEADIYKRERDLEGKLAEIAAKRQVAGDAGGAKKRFTPIAMTIEDENSPNGLLSIRGTVDTFTGKHYYGDGQTEVPGTKIRSSYAVQPEEFDRRTDIQQDNRKEMAKLVGRDMKMNPRTGELDLVETIRNQVANADSGRITVKDEKDLAVIYKELASNKQYQSAADTLTNLPRATAMAEAASRQFSPNSMAVANLRYTLVKLAQGAGIVTDQDIENAAGSSAEKEKLRRFRNLQVDGTAWTKRDADEAREVIGIYSRLAQDRMRKLVDTTVGAAKSTYEGLKESDVRSRISPLAAGLPDQREQKAPPGSIFYRGVTHTSKNPKVDTLPVALGAEVYFIAPSEWEKFKKENPGLKRLDK
jgi:hypothetical protein